MPHNWITASRDYRDGKITAEQLEKIVESRKVFQLIEKCRNADGSMTYKSLLRDRAAKLHVDGVVPHLAAVGRELRRIRRG